MYLEASYRKSIKIAKMMIEKGYDIKDVIQISGLTEDEILQLVEIE